MNILVSQPRGKSPKKAGDLINFKLRRDVDERVIQFINIQDNLTDSIIYLIEKDIAEYGVRNLQEVAPYRRTIESLKAQLMQEGANLSNEPIQRIYTQPPTLTSQLANIQEEQVAPDEQAVAQDTVKEPIQENKHQTDESEQLAKQEVKTMEENTSDTISKEKKKVDEDDGPDFSETVLESWK